MRPRSGGPARYLHCMARDGMNVTEAKMNMTMVELGTGRERAEGTPAVMFVWDVWQLREVNALAVRFQLHMPARVTVRLSSIDGRLTKVLFDAPRYEGEFSEVWRFIGRDGRPVAPGIYMVSLELDGELTAETTLIKD